MLLSKRIKNDRVFIFGAASSRPDLQEKKNCYPHFATCAIVGWLPVFTRPETVQIIAKEIGDSKSYTARRIIDFLKERKATTLLDQLAWHKARHKSDRTFQVWQEGSHPQEILSEDISWQKLD